jgi:hypothetical protein
VCVRNVLATPHCFDLLFIVIVELYCVLFYLPVWWLRDFVIYGSVLLRPSEYLRIIKVLIDITCTIFYRFKTGGQFDIICCVCNLPPRELLPQRLV